MFGAILGFVCFASCVIVGLYKFGFCGALLSLAAWTSACIYFGSKRICESETVSRHDSCDGCKHYLGGGCCRQNLEAECCEGGGFEMWEE